MTQTRRLPATIGSWLGRHPYVLPTLIVLVGAVFRFYNLNWDNGHELHPDERWIYEVVSGANNNPGLSWPTSWSQFTAVQDPTGGSPLNPHFFAYGSLPFYLLALLAGLVSFIGQHVPGLSSWATVDTYGGLPPLGRGFSGCIDLFSVFLVFLLGRRVFGYWVGVTAMAFTAFTVLNIQLAHFFTVDTVLLPFILLTLLAAVTIATSNDRAPYIWGGIAFGAALATKTTALLLVVPLGAAAILSVWDSTNWPASGALIARLRVFYLRSHVRLNRNLQWILGTFVIAGLSFAVFEPYAVLDRTQLFADLSQQTIFLVTNNPPFVVPYTIQYAGDIPYIYQLQNILFWSMGIPLAATAFSGVIYGFWRILRGRIRPDQVVLLLWIVPYFLFVGSFFAKFNRYMLPIMPVMAIFGAGLLVALIRVARARWRYVASGLLAAVTLLTFLYSLAYMNIYANLNTRVAASRWIYAHVPVGSNIAVEGPWDDPLPLDEQGHSGGLLYHFTNLDLYAGEDAMTDAQHKIANITDVLTHYQYIVMSSERLIGSIPKLPLRYPVANRYYQLLFAGKLNFRLVRVFQAHPQLGPVTVEDYSADESFHVYDHPIVRIWRRTGPISAAQVHHLLTTGLVRPPPSVDPATLPAIIRPALPPLDKRLMLSSTQWHQDQQGGTLDSMFPPGGFAMSHPIIVWLLVLELLGLLAFPFCFPLFSRLLDRGFVVGKTFGVLLLGYLVWIAVSIGAGTYERGLIYVCLAVLCAAAAIAAFRQRVSLLAFVRLRWRRMLAGELVFLAGFTIFILLRMWYPDLGHQFSPVAPLNLGAGRMGEKQMELAFLNAIVRSRVFPPYDPFFSHGFINYYYYGFYLVGTLCKLTEIVPATGFNLAIATFFAMLVGNIFSAAYNLTRRLVPGVLAAVFTGIIGNLNGGWQLVQALMSVATVHYSFPVFGGVIDVVSGLERTLITRQPLPPFDFWGPTRIVPGGAITEFPYFTYLFADLHPHLIAFPMTAAALVLAIQFIRGGYQRLGPRLTAIVLGGLLTGAIAVTNPWDFPTYLLVIGLAALIGAAWGRKAFSVWVLARPIIWMAALSILSLILYLPFKRSYQTVFASGIGLVRDVSPASLQSLGVCPTNTTVCPGYAHDVLVTPLRIYLEHFGLFLFIILSFLVLVVGKDLRVLARLRRLTTWIQFGIYYRERLPALRRAMRVARALRGKPARGTDLSAVWGTAIVVAALVLLQYYLLAFLIAALGLASFLVILLGRRLTPVRTFVVSLFGLGLTISVLTQVFFVKDFLAGGPSFRMNTIFKFYNQVWVLFALSAACCLYYFMDNYIGRRENRALRLAGFSGRTPDRLNAFASATEAEGTTGLLRRRPALAAVPVLYSAGSGASLPVEDETGLIPPPAAQPTSGITRTHRRRPPWGRALALIDRQRWWAAGVALLLIGSLVYTYAGTVARETYRTAWLPETSVPFTLDGMAFMKVAYPGDYAAINWINAHVTGAPVIAEAGPSYYDWRSRVSMFTGLPTIINGIHESEQRFGDEIDPSSLCGGARNPSTCLTRYHSRVDDLNTLYNTTQISEAWRVIRTYGVGYIYVGFSERQCNTDPNNYQCYSRAGLAKFNRMVGHGLARVYDRLGTTIYQVTRT